MNAPLLLFAPGAGAPSSHPWMQEWAGRLSSIGRVELFDYDYQRQGRRRPDPLPQLIAAHRGALWRARRPGGATILIGKSMGGRIGCHVALVESVQGLICLGYPLYAGGDPSRLRDQVLRELRTPVLFIQGTHDALCPLPLLAGVRKEMKAPSELLVVEGANHSLSVRKQQLRATGETQEDIDKHISKVIAKFVARVTGGTEAE